MEYTFIKDIEFDWETIKNNKEKINLELKKYIESNIIPEYKLNDEGHNVDHINYVLNRAFEISNNYSLNIDMLYACVMFHDIACHIDRERHEILSSERALNDKYLNKYFVKKQLIEIANAIEDHRASLERDPRNIYGKILSSADRKVEIKVYLISSISFALKNNPQKSKEKILIESYDFAVKKFGVGGYAINKIYVNDQKYKYFLETLQFLIKNKDLYFKLAGEIYDSIK